MEKKSTVIMDRVQIERTITRMAWEIYEKHHDSKRIMLAGIKGRGVDLMIRMAATLRDISPLSVDTCEISIDKNAPWTKPIVFNPSPFDHVLDVPLVVIDDVLNSGKTMLYALSPVLPFEVKKLTAVVLIDRSHKRYPILADVVGLKLSTSSHEHVRVQLLPGKEKVYLE
ncbi:MAG: phosphoribosyltransferase [Cryomorphaceae bacterium]|nr:phosphoribosyltransferase [Cryomorphaceae bacterium]